MNKLICSKKAQAGTLIYWICFFIFLLLLFLSIFKLNAPFISKFIIVILLAGLSAYFKSKNTFINFVLLGIGALLLSIIIATGLGEFFVILIVFVAFYFIFRFLFKKGYFAWGR